MPTTTTPQAARLQFDPAHLDVGGTKDLRTGLSAVASDGDHLWLACDEGCRLERLTREASSGAPAFGGHHPCSLKGLVPVPAGDGEEADIEGLDVDDGFVWIVGSHSVKRKKANENDEPEKVGSKLAKTSRGGNRHLLARVPVGTDGSIGPGQGARRAAAVASTLTSSALLDAILAANDPHLAPFVPIPGKDNGLDIEGLAVRGERVFVGLRGPVLRGWCVVLELRLVAEGAVLRPQPLDGTTPYRKHFLPLGGLGVRDLLWVENDLLVLAGPTMTLDGPCEIWRWRSARTMSVTHTPRVERLRALPHAEGVDKAEGFTLLDQGPPRVLVVYDTPSPARLVGAGGIVADVFRL